MGLTPEGVATYLRRYIAAYRDEYRRLTSDPPDGAGYPQLAVSPYLTDDDLLCLLATDGVVILDQSHEPDYAWWIAGGPAIMADFPDTRTPPRGRGTTARTRHLGKPIGIYRVVSNDGIPEPIWRGELDPVVEQHVASVDGKTIDVRRFPYSLQEVLQRLTYGALGLIIDIGLPSSDADFWTPHIVRSMGFFPADRHDRRFVSYLEVSVHTDPAAWDPRSIAVRAGSDVRRDFGHVFSLPEQGGGTIAMGRAQFWTAPYRDRLARLRDAIDTLAEALASNSDADESVFHEILRANPILLDVYGEAISKPRLNYPVGHSPLGKSYVEPDFILRYPGNSYRLVELEKPGKAIATSQGQPRAEVTRSTFQMGEWRAYIANHYDEIRREFPGISTGCSAMIVISRSTPESFGAGRDLLKYKELLRSQYPGIDVLTYDDLLERAKVAYVQLAGLAIRPQGSVGV